MYRTLKYLKQNHLTFLLFELAFRISMIFLFTEGAGKIVDILLHFQGFSYVTQGNYISFLSHPTVIIGLSMTGIILLYMILYELCALFILLDAGRNKERVSMSLLLKAAGIHSFDFMKRYPVKWILFMLLCMPNLYLHLLIWEIDRARFIDIVVADIYDKISIPVFVILLCLYLLAAIIFSVSLPYRIFGKEKAFDTGILAFSIRKGKQLRNLLSCLYLHIRVFISTGLVYMMAVVICVGGIRIFRPVYRYVSDTLFYGSILKLLLGIIIGFLGTVTITGYLYSVFGESEETCIDWTLRENRKSNRWITAATLVLTAIIILFEAPTFIPDTTEAQDYLEISAHRGGAKFAPENTLAAIQYSIDTKADYAEIDVQETADGVIVLLHDNWLARTTGLKKYIWDIEYEELATLDAGSHFRSTYAGERVPTLAEVIEACRGKLRLNIEIKSNGHNQDIVEKVLAVVQEEKFESNCVITSMDYKILREIKELSPEMVTGYTLSMVYGRVEDMDAADFYSVKYTFVTPRLVERVHEMGKMICAWTTNNRQSIRKVIDAGVDNVITDNPELVRKELLGEYEVIPSFYSLVKYMIQ